MCKKLLALLLAMLMTISLLATPAMAAANEPEESSFPDSAGHWAETSIDRWADSGIVQGDDQGNVTPDAFLKRGELAQMLVRLLGLTEVAENTFGDLKGTEWYAQPVLKCAAAGIMQGDDRHYILGNDPVTRQEAMVMLGRSLGMQKAQKPDMSQFGDAEDVDDWGACYMAPLAQMGILTGIHVAGQEQNMVVPDGPINRASMLTLLDRAITTYVTEPGEYTVDNANGFVVVNVQGAGDVAISGTTAGVVVTHGTDEAAVTLSAVTADTVRVDGDGDVRIEEKSAVDELTVNGNSDVTITKNSAVEDVVKNSEDATVTQETTNPPVVIRPSTPSTPSTPESEASETTFSVMDADLYNTINWAGKPALTAMQGSDVTFTPGTDDATTVAVTGTLKYVEGFAGFNATKTEEQEGNYLALMFSVPADATDAGTITLLKGHEGTTNKTYKVGDEGAVDTVSGAKYFALIQRVASTESEVQIKIDWDGAGEAFSENTYTLTFTGATLESKTVETPAVASETTFSVMDADLYNTIDWAGKPALTAMQENVTFTPGTGENATTVAVGGTLKYVKHFTGFNATKTEEQEGNYLALMFSVPSEATDAATITLVAGHEGTTNKEYTVGTPGAVDTVGDARYFALIQRVASTESEVQIEIDWDGAGNKYSESTYTLTFTGATLVEKVPAVENAKIALITDEQSYDDFFGAGKYDTDTVNGTHDIQLPWLAVKYQRNETGEVTFSVKKDNQTVQFGTTDTGKVDGNVEKSDTLTFEATSVNAAAWVSVHLLSQETTDHKGQVWLDNADEAAAAGHYVVTISLNGETTTAEYDVPNVTVVKDKVVAMRQALDTYYGTYYDKFVSQWIADPGLVSELNTLTNSTGFSDTNFDAAKVYFPVGDWTTGEVTGVTVNDKALNNGATKTSTSIGNNGFIYSYAWKVIDGKLCLNLPMLAGLAGTNQKGEAVIQVNGTHFVTLKLFNFPEQNTLTLTGASNHGGLENVTFKQVSGTWTVTGKVTGGNSLLGVTFGYKEDPASETITEITDASTGNYMIRQKRGNVQSTAITELGEAGVSYRLYPYGWADGATKPTEDKTLNFTIVVPGCGSIDLDVDITVAPVEASSFETLKAALEDTAAKKTIVLTQDFEIPASGGAIMKILAGQDVTLDLAGHTITNNYDNTAFVVPAGATLTVVDHPAARAAGGKIVGDENDSIFKVAGGTLNLQGGTFTCEKNDSDNYAATGVYVTRADRNDPTSVKGTANIGEGVTIQGGSYGARVDAGVINITGGTVRSDTNATVRCDNSDGTVNISGGTIQGSQAADKNCIENLGTVNITGESTQISGFNGIAAFNGAVTNITDATITVKGIALGAGNNLYFDEWYTAQRAAGLTAEEIDTTLFSTFTVGGAATITSEDCGVYMPANGKLTLKDTASISGTVTGIVARMGTIDLQGGSVTSATARTADAVSATGTTGNLTGTVILSAPTAYQYETEPPFGKVALTVAEGVTLTNNATEETKDVIVVDTGVAAENTTYTVTAPNGTTITTLSKGADNANSWGTATVAEGKWEFTNSSTNP